MNAPSFTTKPERIARLQYNYDEGLAREKIPSDLREKLDAECLVVSKEKLHFLFQNAMESYSKEQKNQQVVEWNKTHASVNENKVRSFFRLA